MTGASLLYPPSGEGSFVALSGGGIRFGSLQLGTELREQIFKAIEGLPDGVGLVFDRSVAEVHAFHIPQGVRGDLIEQIDGVRSRCDQAKQLADDVVQPVGDGHQAIDVSGGFFIGKHVVLLVLGGAAAGDDASKLQSPSPASSSGDQPTEPPPSVGIPSADAPPPASAEPLSHEVTP